MMLLIGFLVGVAVTSAACLFGDTHRPYLGYGRTYPGWVDTMSDHGRVRVRARPTRTRTRPTLVDRITDRWTPIPDQYEWNAMFEYVLVKEDIAVRNVKGRHRREVLERDPGWRSRWAGYDTQAWPTLATEGHATDTIALDIRPEICDGGGLLNVDHPGGSRPEREDDARGEAPDVPREQVLPVLRDAYPPGTPALTSA